MPSYLNNMDIYQYPCEPTSGVSYERQCVWMDTLPCKPVLLSKVFVSIYIFMCVSIATLAKPIKLRNNIGIDRHIYMCVSLFN